MADSSIPPRTDHFARARQRRRPLLWWCLLGSAIGHLALSSTIAYLAQQGTDLGVEFEWTYDFSELQGLGHGQQERWADVVITPEPEPTPQPEPEPEPETPQPEPEPIEPEHKPKPKPKPNKRPKTKAKPKPKPAPATKPASAPTKGVATSGPSALPELRNFAPGNARMTSLVRIDRIRGTPFEAAVGQILRAVPDYRLLLASTDVDPMAKFDSLFYASSKPRYLQHTFLAVQHSMSPEELRSALDRRFADKPIWSTIGPWATRPIVPASSDYKDPRLVVVLEDSLAVVARPEHITQLRKPAAKGQAGLLAGLRKIHKAAERDETIVLMSMQGFTFKFRGMADVSSIETIRLSIDRIARPELKIDLQFEKQASAEALAKACPQIKQRALARMGFLVKRTVGPLINRLTCSQDKTYVTVAASYSQREIAAMLGLVATVIPKPKALNKLPKPPQPPATTASPSVAKERPDAKEAAPSKAPPDDEAAPAHPDEPEVERRGAETNTKTQTKP